MKNIFLIIAILFTQQAIAQNLEIYNADRLMQRVSNNDTIYVVNFWATWCGPCVKELPEFEKLQELYKGQAVKILLVSLDFKETYPDKIYSFIKKKKLPHEVVWFNETDANSFIPKIDDRWQGSIPATLIVSSKNEYKGFFEGAVTVLQLRTLIDKQLKLQ